MLKLRYVSFARVIRDVRQDMSQQSATGLLEKIKRKRSLDALGVSTGLLAVLLALREAGRETRIYLIGIGIDNQEGQFYDASGPGRFLHVMAGKAMVGDLVHKVSADSLVFTDPKFATFATDCRNQAYKSVRQR